METVHDLLDRGSVVPPMDIQNVDIGCTKVLQTFFDRQMQRFDMVAIKDCLLLDVCVTPLVIGCVLMKNIEN